MPLLIMLLIGVASGPVPEIAVHAEGDRFRLAVERFAVSQGPAVNEAAERRMQETCAGRAVQRLETDFQTVDPANDLSSGEPVERQIWDYRQTFRCLDPPDGPGGAVRRR